MYSSMPSFFFLNSAVPKFEYGLSEAHRKLVVVGLPPEKAEYRRLTPESGRGGIQKNTAAELVYTKNTETSLKIYEKKMMSSLVFPETSRIKFTTTMAGP